MNKQVVAYRHIRTDRPYAEVLQATEDALRRLGGTLYRNGGTINIQNGTAGVNMAVGGDFAAQALVRPRADGGYEVTCTVTVTPNTVFWVCAIVGFFCLWPLWIVNLFYFITDPLPVYQRALDQIDLPPASSVPPPPVAPPGGQ